MEIAGITPTSSCDSCLCVTCVRGARALHCAGGCPSFSSTGTFTCNKCFPSPATGKSPNIVPCTSCAAYADKT